MKVVCGIECSSGIGSLYRANRLFHAGRGHSRPADAGALPGERRLFHALSRVRHHEHGAGQGVRRLEARAR
ncbi:hypothetical protein GCM10010449_28550 [Streptomyces rectiviolaceus]|uniref:Uncharacterized protein n=1 Tax=Streptomyces rectiviolaceus TaxID=332591 RepID=A0ABP6MDS0_9ACTN